MNFFKKYKNYILAFLIPLFIYTLFFFIKGCFFENTMINADMQAQYLPLFEYLRDVLHGEADFPYTFSKGLGGGMYGTYFYYLSNPLNLLVYFFENVPLFLNILVLLKLSLSGLTMYIFLRHKFREDNKTILIFSLAYALMTYNINYYINIMWLDGVVLAPLILLGIDRILEKRSNFLYIILLFLAIYLNYYIGYILVLFSIIYFLYSYFNKYQKEWKKEYKQILNFLIVTCLTGFITSFILLPCALEMLNAGRVYSFDDVKLINPNFLDLVSSSYIGFGDLINPLNYYGFCIFSGTVMIPLVICYFANPNISRYEKKLTIIVYALLILPVVFPILNLVWHLFTVPVGFNYRYSFLVTLFTLMIAYRSFKNLYCPKKALKVYFIIFVIFAVSLGYAVVITPDYYYYLDVYKIIVTVLLVLINIILILKNKKKLILILLVLELVINLLWIGVEKFIYTYSDYNLAKETFSDLSNSCMENQRCESVSDYSFGNDAFIGNYAGISMFLSTVDGGSKSFLLKSSDVEDARNYYVYHPDLILDMLLGVDLVETQYPVSGYELLQENDSLYLMKNPNALKLGYLVSDDVKNFKSDKTGFFYLEELLQVLGENAQKYIKELPVTKISDTEYKLQKDEDYPYLYLYLDSKALINGTDDDLIFVGDNYVAVYDRYGDEITFTFEKAPTYFKVYTVDARAIEEFSKNRVEMVVDENTGNYIKAHIESNDKATLMTTIPYESGWEVYVNGEKVDDFEILDSFLAIDLSKGYNEIEFKYHIQGIIPGIIISVISLIILLIYQFKVKRMLLNSKNS